MLNLADLFLDARVREGLGSKPALLTDERAYTYQDVQEAANRYANALGAAGVELEHRVLLALPDGLDYVAALFGILKRGAVVVMLNPGFKPEDFAYFAQLARAKAAVIAPELRPALEAAARETDWPRAILTPDAAAGVSGTFETVPTHRDDPALWLFSGGTTGRPKAVVQPHGSFANTTELYGQKFLGYRRDDITLSVPKLFFGYATGANLFFPFSVGATSAVFPERVTAEVLFEKIRRFRPTLLINVPTMVNQMVSHPEVKAQDLSSLRLATSAGEALPVELYRRWKDAFGVELCDGLGTAEMWHIFVSNRPSEVKPGTLGRVVPGFEVKAADDEGRELPPGEVGMLWVKGRSRALGYWHALDKTAEVFRGEWYVSGDLVSRDAEGYFTHHGRGDELLKVAGKWVAPQEVEACLLQHPAVKECAVVGIIDGTGLVKPHAYVVTKASVTADELRAFVRERLDPYKHPREVIFLDDLPRTHLGKVDRAKLRKGA